LFPSDFIKLRDISLIYHISATFMEQFRIKGMSVSIYSRNIMLWTKAKMGLDPERAFVPEGDTGNRGTQFRQGIEQYNLEPWVMPIGVKLNLNF